MGGTGDAARVPRWLPPLWQLVFRATIPERFGIHIVEPLIRT
jgi:hypothetical protein